MVSASKAKVKNCDIIIPVYKPGDTFLRLLRLLNEQEFTFTKLIIFNTVPADDPSYKELTEEMVYSVISDKDRVFIKHISKQEFDHAGTRKSAAKISKADAFICMTDDAVPRDGKLIKKLMEALNLDDKIAVAYARQLPRDGAPVIEAYTRNFNYPDKSMVKSIGDIEKLGIKTFFASNVCCAYKKSIYESLGGFIDTAIFNEDMIYAAAALKAGYMSYYAADACVIHSHKYSFSAELSRNFDMGISQAMHPEVFSNISSEDEGVKLVLKTMRYLISSGNAVKIPGFVIRSAAKLLGYKLGLRYEKLSDKMILRLCMNKEYAKKIVRKRKTP